jgi:CMP-N-acetylneuraminic acid synthetase
VVEVPHHFNPASVMRLEGDRLHPFLEAPSMTRRQDKPRVLARNGPAVLAVRAATIDGGSLYGDHCRPLLMNPEESLDIDTPWDLMLAECVLGRRRA